MLLTGAKGFLGQATRELFEREGWGVVSAVRQPSQPGELKLDLNDPESVWQLRKHPPVSAIVHLGAKVDFNPDADLYKSNVLATALLVEVAKSWSCPFIFASSISVQINPETPYACSKLLAERIIEGSGSKSTVLRFAGVFGWRGPEHLGLNRAIRLAGEGTPPSVTGKGQAKRNYIYVEDAARAIFFALGNGISGTHVVAGSHIDSIGGMMNALSEVFLSGGSPIMVDGPEAHDQVIENSKTFPQTLPFRDALMQIKEKALMLAKI